MHPKLFDIPIIGLPVNSYGFAIMVGFLLATFIAIRRGKLLGIKSDIILDVGIYSMILGLVGGKLNYIIQFYDEFREGWRIFDVTDGGLNWLGAIIGGLIPYIFLQWRSKRHNKPLKILTLRFVFFCIFTLILAITGARTLFLITHSGEYSWDILKSWNSGFVFYGGAIVGVISAILILRSRKEPVLRFLDLAAPSIMLGLAFGRIGCFLNGCCFGNVCEKPWAVVFPKGSPSFSTHIKNGLIEQDATAALPVHPTQLYEAIAVLILFLLLSSYWRKKYSSQFPIGKDPLMQTPPYRAGMVISLLGMLYPLWRFTVEFFRGDNEKIWFGTLTYSQGVSLLVFVVCALWFIILSLKAPKAREVTHTTHAD